MKTEGVGGGGRGNKLTSPVSKAVQRNKETNEKIRNKVLRQQGSTMTLHVHNIEKKNMLIYHKKRKERKK